MTTMLELGLPQVYYTPTEVTIITWLSDGKCHAPIEYLGENYHPSDRATLSTHVSNLRKKLNKGGLSVVCESQGRRSYYRMVRLLSVEE